MTQIKFCGIRRQEDVDYANEVKPDYIGFVFWPKSKRYIHPEEAIALADRVSEEITIVGVFLDETPEMIIEIAATGCIDMIQLHGNESERYVNLIKNLTGLPVIRAFTIKSEEDIEKVSDTCADYLMVDSGAGTGKTFDWSLLEKVERPYFLAGGIDCDNVSLAIEKLHPLAVDVSSGIETDGFKDVDKMRKFKDAVEKTA